MKMWSSHLWLRFKESQLSPKNVFGASTGFEPVASALALQYSANWAMKTQTLGPGQFIEFSVPVKGMKHMNIMWTADIRMRFKSQSQQRWSHLHSIRMSAVHIIFILLLLRKWFEPRSSIPWLKKIIWVIGVLRRTVVSDRRFDNLCGSHLQSQVVSIDQSNRSPGFLNFQLTNTTTWLWRWLPHRLSKRQSLTTVLLRTPITQMIFFNQGIIIIIVGSLSKHDGDGSENVIWKCNFLFLQSGA